MADMTATGLKGSHMIPAEVQERDRLALEAFEFFFDDGDHQIREMKLLKRDRAIEVAFRDRNNDDRWSASARYGLVPDARWTRTLTGQVAPGGNSTFIEIPGMTNRLEFALAGFRFDAGGNKDQHLHRIKVFPGDSQGRRTRLRPPFGVHVDFMDRDRGEPIHFEIQYTLVPSHIRMRARTDVGVGNRRQRLRLPHVPSDTYRLISGFDIFFVAGTDIVSPDDAHLRRFTLDPRNNELAFNDNDTEEWFRWGVRVLDVTIPPVEPFEPIDPGSIGPIGPIWPGTFPNFGNWFRN